MGYYLAITGFAVFAFMASSCPAKELNYSFIADSAFFYKTGRQTSINTRFDFNDVKKLGRFPLSFNRWKGQELMTENNPVIKPDFMFEREYMDNKGGTVWFQLIRGRIERAVHVPAICYYNSGWQIMEHTSDTIKIGSFDLPCGRIVAKINDTYATELYFYLWKSPTRDFMKGCVMFRIAHFDAGANSRESASLIKDFIKNVFNETG